MLLSEENKKLFLILFLGLIVRLFFVFQGIDFLMRNSIIYDDAFVTFSIARNTYSGNGFSFNGLESTSGSPLTWPILLSAFGFLSKGTFAVFSSMLAGTFFVLAGIPLYSISQKIFGEKNLSLIILILFLFNPFFILISLNGLETSLFIFSMMLTFWYYLAFVRETIFSFLKILLLALLLLFSVLAREEGYLLFLTIVVDQLLFSKQKTKTILVLVLFFAALISPLFVYRLYFFGNFVSSNLYNQVNSPWSFKHGFILQRIGVFVLIFTLINTSLGSIFLSFSGFILVGIKNILKLFPLMAYVFFNISFYSLVVPVGTFRYSLPSSVILTIGLGIFLTFIKEKLKPLFKGIIYKSVFAIFIILFFGLLSLTSLMIWTNVRYGGDGEVMWNNRNVHMYQAAKFINDNMQKNTVVAATHIGTLQYFLEKRYVIDAGGKVDYKSIDSIRNNKLFEYLESKNVSYMLIRNPVNFHKYLFIFHIFFPVS